MTYCKRAFIIPVLCSVMFAGCSARFKDTAGERLSLAGYDRVSVKPVAVDERIDRPNLSQELTARVRDRLAESDRWAHVASETQPAAEAKSADPAGGRQVDLAVTVLKAKYPSRSKIIWLGSAHKMTCRLEVNDHATGELLGRAKASVSVEPLLGNAALLNAGWVGILARTSFDRRKHDANVLLADMADEIVGALDKAKK